MMHGREEEARIVLIRLRNSREEVENELSEIKEQLNVKQQGWNLFKENRNFRRSVSLGNYFANHAAVLWRKCDDVLRAAYIP